MSEPKLISPMLDNFDMGDPISDRNGVRCCPAMEKNSDNKYIVKIISTPASQVQLDALLLSGAYDSKEQALSYFKSIADGIVEEVEALNRLSQLEGFEAFEKVQVVPMESDETGYDVYLLSTYRNTLAQHLRYKTTTHLEAINLGLDICAALAACRRLGYLFVNLKPGNIYMTDSGYRIGDLGFIKLDALKFASLPERYRSEYTAPEIEDAFASLNTTIDIYATGLILYQVFNNGELPSFADAAAGQPIPAPAYADYEMAEIILKACASDPASRWQDPIEMGQALVSYMQRNGAHDTPITPVAETPVVDEPASAVGSFEAVEVPADEPEVTTEPDAVEVSEEAEATEPTVNADENTVTEEPAAEPENTTATEETAPAAEEVEEITEESIYTEDDNGNLTLITDLIEDETLPDETADIEYGEITDEVSDILQQADELIAHETPEGVVQPEPIDVPVPPPIVLEPEPEQPEETSEEASEENESAETEEQVTEEQDEEENTEPEDEEAAEKKKKTAGIWIRNTILAFTVLVLGVCAFFFYKYYYLQPIDAIKATYNTSNNSVSVEVTSKISDEKLTVVRSDAYGNQVKSPVVNDVAEFTDLVPGTAYTFKVEISGFHSLTGETTTELTTPSQTKIINFTAVTGSEDGSIILSFAFEGPEPKKWKVTYNSDNVLQMQTEFTERTVTLNGFTVGNEYTFKLEPMVEAGTNFDITGQTEITYTASKIIKAEDLMIADCTDGVLTAAWSAPKNAEVASWTVRCFNDKGFDETTVTETATASFNITDTNTAYTVEVTASGMSVSERTVAKTDAISVKNFKAEYTADGLLVTWEPKDTTLTYDWRIKSSVDGSAIAEYKCGTETQVLISPAIPGSTYKLILDNNDGETILGGLLKYETPEPDTFDGYGVTADNMEFTMCKRPSYAGWNRYSVANSDYKTQFTADEIAGFIIQLDKKYNTPREEVTSLFVIRNENGEIVSTATSTEIWRNMWYRYYCELDIPALPSAVGNYTISIYFNNQFVKTIAFSIVE